MTQPATTSSASAIAGESALAGETALVTGAASNIGKAVAERLALEGARVLLSDVDAERGQFAAAALVERGLDAAFIAADLSDPAAAAVLARTAVAQLERVSLFVHSASPARKERDTVFAVDDDTFDRMMNVNARSGFVLGRDIGRHMHEHGVLGRMVYITSLHTGTPRQLPHYSASKAAEQMVMQELARALGPLGIRVNAVAPGAVMGGGFRPSGANEAALRAKIPMRRTGLPEEVAQAVLGLLLQRFSSYITGTTLVVDGGLSLYNWIADEAATPASGTDQ